jgi:putative aldouronate transport system permease protein
MKLSKTDLILSVFINVFMIIAALICVLPIVNILARSLSSAGAISTGRVWFLPVEFGFHGWEYILVRTSYLKAFGNSVFITLTGTCIALVVTTLTAYSLSHHRLVGYRFFVGLYVGIMLFHAGMLPNYFQIQAYGLLNTLWALILPGIVSSYNMFVLKKNMEAVPESLEEAALIDGASYLQILLYVIIPVSKASIATIAVFYSVHYWNKYFDALLYITDNKLKPITLFLYELVKNSAMESGYGEVDLMTVISIDLRQAAGVMLTVLPILMIYPFMQKYFVKGTLVGAVKG